MRRVEGECRGAGQGERAGINVVMVGETSLFKPLTFQEVNWGSEDMTCYYNGNMGWN